MFSRSKYWLEKANNIGSKREKSFKPNRFQPDDRKSRREDFPCKHKIRNSKTHRDMRTAERGSRIGGMQYGS